MRKYKMVRHRVVVGFALIALACACYSIWGLRSRFDFIWGPLHLTAKAQICLKRGDLDNALAFANRAVRCSPDLWMTYWTRAEVLEARGDFRDSIQDYTKVVSLGEYSGLADRGRVYEKMGERDKAAADYCEAVLTDRTHLAFNVGIVAFERVRRLGEYSGIERYPDAVPSLLKFIEEAIEQDPDNRDLRECRELILRSEGEGGDTAGLLSNGYLFTNDGSTKIQVSLVSQVRYLAWIMCPRRNATWQLCVATCRAKSRSTWGDNRVSAATLDRFFSTPDSDPRRLESCPGDAGPLAESSFLEQLASA